MKKSSQSFTFHFPPKYHPASFTNYILPSFSKTRPKYLRSLEITHPKTQFIRPTARNLKHVKYISALKATFNRNSRGKKIRIEFFFLVSKLGKNVQITTFSNENSSIALINRSLFGDFSSLFTFILRLFSFL